MKNRLKAAYYALRGHGVIINTRFLDAGIDRVVVEGRKGKRLLIVNNDNISSIVWSRQTEAK